MHRGRTTALTQPKQTDAAGLKTQGKCPKAQKQLLRQHLCHTAPLGAPSSGLPRTAGTASCRNCNESTGQSWLPAPTATA